MKQVGLGEGEKGFLKLNCELEFPEPWLVGVVRKRSGEGG